MTGFLAILQNVVRSTRRDRTALIFTLILPIFLMGLFGTIFGGSGPSIKIGVVNQDRGPLSAQLITIIRAQRGLDVETGSRSHELDRLHRDDVVLVAVIPPGFQKIAAAPASSPTAITTYLDRNQLQSASLAQSALAQIVAGFSQRLSGRPARIVLRSSKVDTRNVNALDFYLPSMMAYIILLAGIQAVAIALVDLRERRVLRRFLATPLSPLQILGGQIVGRAVTVLLQVLVLVAVALLVFHAHSHGSWPLAALCILIGIACFVSLGFLVTGFARTSETARGIASAISFPMMFLSGIFFPLDQLPGSLQDVVHVFPLTYLSDALHHVMNDGDGLAAVSGDLLVLAAWAVVSFAIAARRFRWE